MDNLEQFIRDGVTAIQTIEKYAPERIEREFILSVRASFRSRALLYAFEHFKLSHPVYRDKDEILPESIAKIVVECEVDQFSLKYPQLRYNTYCFASPPDEQSMVLIPTCTIPNLIDNLKNIHESLTSFREKNKKWLAKLDNDDIDEMKMITTILRNLIVSMNHSCKHMDYNFYLEDKYSDWGNCVIRFEMSDYRDIPVSMVIFNDTPVENQDLCSIKTIFTGEKLVVTDD